MFRHSMGRSRFVLPVVLVGSVFAVSYSQSEGSTASREPVTIEWRGPFEVREEAARAETHAASVFYREGSVTKLAATVEFSPRGIHVAGRVGAIPFKWDAVPLEIGEGVRTRLEYSTEVFEAELTTPPDEAALSRFIRFRGFLESTPEWTLVQRISEALQRTEFSESGAVFAALAVHGAGGPLVPQAGPIGEYVDCLKEACADAGGCWVQHPVAGCAVCPGAGVGEAAMVGIVYALGAEVCWFRLLIPIPWH